MALPVYQRSAYPPAAPWASTKSSANLTSLGIGVPADRGAGPDGDVLITGLPLTTVEHALEQVENTEHVLFSARCCWP